MNTLDQEAKRILSGLGHAVDTEDDFVIQKAAQPKKPEIKVEEKKVKESLVLRQLRDTFGIENLKKEDVVIEGLVFTLKALTARWVAWADSMALQSLIRSDGTYNIPEYQVRLEIFLAGCCVDSINGEPLTDIFEAADIRLAKAKFIDFILDESKDGLAKQIWTEYSNKIEEKAKIMSATSINDTLNLAAYKCTKCGAIETYEKREAPYFCHKDGEQLSSFEVETTTAPLGSQS